MQGMEVMQIDGLFALSEVLGGLSLHSEWDFPVAMHLQATDCTIELKISLCSSGLRFLASPSVAVGNSG